MQTGIISPPLASGEPYSLATVIHACIKSFAINDFAYPSEAVRNAARQTSEEEKTDSRDSANVRGTRWSMQKRIKKTGKKRKPSEASAFKTSA